MVSLAVVENCASAVWPDNMHAAAILPDPKKGEQVILVTDKKDASRSLLLAWAQSHGVPEIAVPKKIIEVDVDSGARHRKNRFPPRQNTRRRRPGGAGGEGESGSDRASEIRQKGKNNEEKEIS